MEREDDGLLEGLDEDLASTPAVLIGFVLFLETAIPLAAFVARCLP